MICGKYINISWFLLLITGWWLTYPSEKYESQWKGLSDYPIYEMGKKNV